MVGAVPAVAVVIPTYQRPALLARCLASLAAQDVEPATFEVCVVDDHSGPATEAVLREHESVLPSLRWARQTENRGPAAARNRAVALGTAEVLLFLDDDVEAAPDLVAVHARRHADGDAATGYVGHVTWAPDLTVTPFMRWLERTDLQFAYETRMQPGPLPAPEQAFYTCNLSIARRAFEDAGGFDERFPHPAYEDVELGHRLGQRGFTLVYDPSARAFHTRAIDLRTFCARMELVAESAIQLRRTHPEVPVTVTVPPHGARATAVRLLAGAAACLRPTIAGRDVRSRHYWSAIEHAQLRGLRRAGLNLADGDGRPVR